MRNAIGRTRSGPPPDPNALRRDRPSDKTEFVHLPAAGREGEPPTWPLTRPSKREIFHWDRLWKLPQAVAWEGRYTDAVASYVRALAIAESPFAKAADRTLAKQYQDTLGLTDAGLRSNRWIIDATPEQQPSVRTNDPDRRSARTRFKTITGGAA